MSVDSIKVTVWNEYRHERKDPNVAKVYPEGMHKAIATYLGKQLDLDVRTATLDEPEHGLTDDVLAHTDVLIWWGHMAHKEVSDVVVERVYPGALAHILRLSQQRCTGNALMFPNLIP